MTETIPTLDFPMLKYGRLATPWDLRIFLYKGASALNRKAIARASDLASVGAFLPNRIPLVYAFHDEVLTCLVGGGSHSTAVRQLISLRVFFKWADINERDCSIESIEKEFINWTNDLLRKQKASCVKMITIYSQATTIGVLIERILNLETSILQKTHIKKPSDYQNYLSGKSEKEKISSTFEFGKFLMDICDALSPKKIRSPLPIIIPLSQGGCLEEWCGLVKLEKIKSLNGEKSKGYKHSMKKREIWSEDTSMRTRSGIVNLRVQAELLIFIAHTGMNLAQAYQLKFGKFNYSKFYDGYQVKRIYKDRKKGDVEFEIFSSYRVFFERYLSWRKEFFEDDEAERLFTLESRQGRSKHIAPEFTAIEKRCADLGIEYFGPRILRKTRQNWLLRRSGDVTVTAQLGQHTPDTLLKYYIRPNHQVAMREVSRFHKSNEEKISPPGPGVCVKKSPQSSPLSPVQSPQPDCINPSGCLFCMHHRDIDTFDYIWSLVSYRYLKAIEISMSNVSPVSTRDSSLDSILGIISAKLSLIGEVPHRQLWIVEANARVWESYFHPQWEGFITLTELADV